VQVFHHLEGDAEDGQLGERADLHLVEGEPGGGDDRRLVDVDPGLVGDLNTP